MGQSRAGWEQPTVHMQAAHWLAGQLLSLMKASCTSSNCFGCDASAQETKLAAGSALRLLASHVCTDQSTCSLQCACEHHPLCLFSVDCLPGAGLPLFDSARTAGLPAGYG